MTTNNVKLFHSGMTGAPVLTGQAGKLIDVLDACLINGFGSGTADSVVIAGGIATVTRAAGHSFEVDAIALIGGATVTGGTINGEQRVLSITSTTYTFATAVADQTATGTITHKLAPLDWAKTFSGTNLAAYKPGDVAATGCLLRVDDTGTTTARVVGYEAMSGISTGTGPFPTAAQVSGGLYWNKSQTADATARLWYLIGDSRGFYLHVQHYTAGPASNTTYFGDFASRKSPDPYGACLVGQTAALGTAAAGAADLFTSQSASNQAMYAPRGVFGLGGSIAQRRVAFSPFAAADGSGSGGASFATFPNPGDNALLVVPMAVSEISCWRGMLPGAHYCPQNVGTTYALGNKVPSVSGLPGRTLLALTCGSLTNAGSGFIDITGPWVR